MNHNLAIIIMYHDTGSMYKSGSPFESNYQLPIVRISCGTGVTNISECQFTTRLHYYSDCSHRNSIGIYCQGIKFYTYIEVIL